MKMLAKQALRGWGRYPGKHWHLMKQNYISKPTQLLLHDHMLPSCMGYARFVHVYDLCSISCPFRDSFMLFCRSLNKIFINTWHSPSFLPLATHTWWQEDGPHRSSGSHLQITKRLCPPQTKLIHLQSKKAETPQHHQPHLLKLFSILYWTCEKNTPRDNFLQISSGSHWVFVTRQQMRGSHTARSMLVILSTSFIQSFLHENQSCQLH